MDIFTSSDSEFEFQFEIDDKEYLDVIAEIEDKTSDTGEDAVKIKPKCTICNKEFARKYNLERHLMIHQASRCYICEICGKTIRGAISLHQKTHSDFKAFSCKTCGKQFRQKLGLKCHEMIHSGIKPFTCGTCGRKFRQKQSLIHHMPRHTGHKTFICAICGAGFSEKASLQKHSVIHSTRKPYQCEFCDQCFRHKSSLVRHKRVHGRVTNCEYCGRKFRYESFLQKHISVMHQGEDTKISELEQISVILPQELNDEELSTSLQTVTIIHNPTIIQVSETPITYQYYQTLEETLPIHDQQTINISVPAIHYQAQS